MDTIQLADDDKYDKQCGEVFLTLNGCIIFHCKLCDCKYKGVHGFASHIIEKHYEPAYAESEDDLISNYSISNGSDEGMDKMEFLDEYQEALQEEEIPISAIKEKNENRVMTAVSVMDEREDSMTTQWEEIRAEPQRKKRKPSPKRVINPEPPVKPLTEAEKLRKANEEALLKNKGKLVYKQPLARGDFPDSERKHRCNFCGFAFKDASNLLAHIKRHFNQRNFQCTYCPKMFSTRTEIEEHSRRHTGDRPFVCEYENCGKAYFTRSELNAHIKRHLNKRDFKCEICDRRFYDSSDVKEHMISHTQERTHECIVCYVKFSRRKALLNHMKLHENKREYECELCGASFNQRPGLSSHMRSKHKQKC